MTDEANPEISVILPARNAATTIQEMIESLYRQTVEVAFEIVVVDNGSTDDTAQAATAVSPPADAADIPLRVLHYTDRFGHASPRNHGADHALGHWLAFCDADDAVDVDWLAELFAARTERALIASQHVDLESGAHPTAGLTRVLGQEIVGTGGLFCSAETFREVGGFDPAFDRGGADADFSIRARQHGLALKLCPSARYLVRRRSAGAAVVRQARRYASNRARLISRHQDEIKATPSSYRMLIGRCRLLIVRLPWLLTDDRDRYLRMLGRFLGGLEGSIRHRIRYWER